MVQIETIPFIGGSIVSRMLTSIVALSVVLSLNATHAQSGSIQKIASPCAEGFELSLSVKPVDSIGSSSEIGVRLNYSSQARSLASRLHTDQVSPVNKNTCELWQKNYWHLFKRLLSENKDPERKGMVCRNVATVRYKVGVRDTQSSRVCLGNAHNDGLSHVFQKIYDGTDYLVGR